MFDVKSNERDGFKYMTIFMALKHKPNFDEITKNREIIETMKTKHTFILGSNLVGYYLESKDSKIVQKHNVIHVSFGNEHMDDTLYTKSYPHYKEMFDFFITNNEQNILNILLLSYTHKFHRLNMEGYVDELFYLYQLSCRIHISPNPLLIFLVEGKLYYYLFGKINQQIKNEEIGLDTTTNNIILPTITTISHDYKKIKGISNERYQKIHEQYMKFVEGHDIYSKTYANKVLKFGWSGNNSCVIDTSNVGPLSISLIKKCLYSQIKIFQQTITHIDRETKVYKIGEHIFPLKSSLGMYRNNNRISNTPEYKLKSNVEFITNNLYQILTDTFGNAGITRFDYFFDKDDVKLNEIELYQGSLTYYILLMVTEYRDKLHTEIEKSYTPYLNGAVHPYNSPDSLKQFNDKPDMDSMTKLLILLQQKFRIPNELLTMSVKDEFITSVEYYFVTTGKLPPESANNTDDNADDNAEANEDNNAGANAGGGMFKNKKRKSSGKRNMKKKRKSTSLRKKKTKTTLKKSSGKRSKKKIKATFFKSSGKRSKLNINIKQI